MREEEQTLQVSALDLHCAGGEVAITKVPSIGALQALASAGAKL